MLGGPEYIRYYDSTMKALADRGHHVMVAVNELQERKHARLEMVGDGASRCSASFRRAAIGGCRWRAPCTERSTSSATSIRGCRAPALRRRMYRKVLPSLLRPLDRIHSLRERSLGRLIRFLQAWERAVPVGR